MMKRRGALHSPTKRKILLLLQAGVALSFTRSVGKQLRIIKSLDREWRGLNRSYLLRCLDEFSHNRLVKYEEMDNGSISVILTDLGETRALKFKIDEMALRQPRRWDGRWRIVAYDIPHGRRAGRDAFQRKLKELGLAPWQKSLFIYPFPCRDEIDFIVEVFDLRPYVRYAEMINPTNEAELKLKFNLR